RLDKGVQPARHHGRGPGAEQVAAQHAQRHLVEPHALAELARRLLHADVHDDDGDVVLQVSADRQVDHRLHADRPQMAGGADAGQHQPRREVNAPPLTITSRSAVARSTCPPFSYSTPVARLPSRMMRLTWARTST